MGLLRTCESGPIQEAGDLVGLSGTIKVTVQPNGKYNKYYFRPTKEGVKKPANVGTTPTKPLDDEPPF
jgi:hypothetical protein